MSGEVGRLFEEDVEGFSLSCIASVSFDGKVGKSCGLFWWCAVGKASLFRGVSMVTELVIAGSVVTDVFWRLRETEVSEGLSFALAAAVEGLWWFNACEVSCEWSRFAFWRATEELWRFKECELCEDLTFSVTTPVQELWAFKDSEVLKGFVFSLGLFGRDIMIRSADNIAMNIDQ